MSEKNENINKQEISEEVKETVQTQELAVTEKKRFQLGPKAKKGLKIAGVAGLGIVSFLLGAKWGNRSNDDSDEIEDVDYEIIDNNDNNENQ